MRSTFRALLMCLLALAIPVQGLAAAARLSCDMRHPEMAAGAEGHEGASHHAPAGDPAAHDGHGAPCAGAMVKCDACSTCAAASAAAIPPAVVPALADAVPDLQIAFREGHRAGRLPERLERPPRTTFL